MEKQRCKQLLAIYQRNDPDTQFTWSENVEELKQRIHWKASNSGEENDDDSRFLWEYVESVVKKGLDVNSKTEKTLSLFPWL